MVLASVRSKSPDNSIPETAFELIVSPQKTKVSPIEPSSLAPPPAIVTPGNSFASVSSVASASKL